MNRKCLVLCAFIFSFCFISQAQTSSLLWAGTIGGSTGVDVCKQIAFDAAGNMFVAGDYSTTADLDPTAGVDNYTSAGLRDMFVTKISPTGVYLWTKTFGGTGWDLLQSMKVDPSGNILITGQYSNVVDFDASPSVLNLTSNGGYDIFVVKLDNSGNTLWAYSFGGTYSDTGFDISTNALDDVFVTGYFIGTVDFDPNAGVANLSSVAVNDADIFVLKLNAAGNYVWAVAMNGVGIDVGQSIIENSAGEVYVAGYFNSTSDFDPGAGTFNLTSNGQNDIFLLKLSNTGSFIWAKSMGDLNMDQALDIHLDASENILMTGYFSNTVDFDPNVGVTNLTSTGGEDVFLAAYDPLGNLLTAEQFGGTGNDNGIQVTTDFSGNIYLTGEFVGVGPIDFDPGPGTANLSSTGGTDIFVLKLDNTGAFSCVEGFGGALNDYAFDLYVDNAYTVHLVGNYQGTIDIDPSVTTNNLVASGGPDGLIGQFIFCGLSVLPIELVDFYGENLIDKNQLFWSTSSERNNAYFQIEKSEDGLDWRTIGKVTGAGNSEQLVNYTFVDDKVDMNSPLSYYRLKQVDFDGQSEYSDVISIRQNATQATFLYPNPGKNYFQISVAKEIVNLRIINSQGKTIKEFHKIDAHQKLDVSGLDSGSYFVEITNVFGEVIILKYSNLK